MIVFNAKSIKNCVCLIWFIAASSYANYFDGLAAIHAENFSRAFKELSPLAQSGDVYSQYYMCFMYEQGKGVEKDLVIANEWYRKAADQGDVRAIQSWRYLRK